VGTKQRDFSPEGAKETGAKAASDIRTLEEEIYSIHGKHIDTQQRRTQEIQTRRTQKAQSRKAAQAPRLRSRIEKAQGQETGPRPGQAVKAAFGIQHLAFSQPEFLNENLAPLNAKC
jgi:hypothetical protein